MEDSNVVPTELQWRHVQQIGMEPSTTLSDAVLKMEQAGIITLPDLRRGGKILIFSDYSEKQRSGDFDLMSFLFMTSQDVPAWDRSRQFVRARLPNNRRMKYAGQNDRYRNAARLPFLRAIGGIPGLSLSVAIPLGHVTLFSASGMADLQAWSGWGQRQLDKAMTAAHIISLVVTSLGRDGQEVLWITDDDEIAANQRMLWQLQAMFRAVLALYSQRDLNRVYCRTTGQGSSDRFVEDCAAVPDLICGALRRVFQMLMAHGGLPHMRKPSSDPFELARRDAEIISWFSDNSQAMKRLVVAITRPFPSGPIHHTWLTLTEAPDNMSPE